MRNTVLSWINIGVAVLSAVGIYFIPEYSLWFLIILLLNVIYAIVVRKHFSKEALTVCRILVGCLFIFSSFTKGVDPLGTKYKMLDYFAAYHIEWLNGAAMVLAVLMILAEFLIGICLLTNVCPKIAVIGGTVFMLLFTAVTLFDALYDVVPDCGCFGTAVKMSNWQTFYKNLVIDAVLLPLILNLKSQHGRLNPTLQFAIGLAFALVFSGFEIYNYRHLPMIDFMPWKVGKQMKQTKKEEPKVYVTYRNKKTGEKKEYLTPNYPWNDSVWMSQWEFVDSRMDGEYGYLGFSAIDEDRVDVTEKILSTEKLFMFTSHDVNGITEKEWGKIKEITDKAEKSGYNVAWVVCASRHEMDSLQNLYHCLNEVYYGDEVEIKTIVRFNPGLILLDDGLVVDKWSAIDFPQGEKLDKVLNR